ncbi:unnamed protein product [Sphagnum troendelagicum]|uniref:Uncharacterized protein n=1 Tax=Sphagnum troendelagicum TaxID=128251 RepID=A0ABP0U528_9BRYO
MIFTSSTGRLGPFKTAKDQSEIMRLRGALDEVSEELEKNKLAKFCSQNEAAGGPLIPAARIEGWLWE